MNLLVWLTLLGLIIAFAVSSILSTLDADSGNENVKYNDLLKKRSFRTPTEWPQMNEHFQNLFWIVQISDIHVSVHHDLARSSDLIRFCSDYLSVIDPEVVIVTGDLTDAKDNSGFVSYQIEEEWKTYKKITSQCRELLRAKWLDIRGNHDSFDVLDFDSKNNYYRSHSGMGNPLAKNDVGYHYKLQLPFGNYSFIGFDAAHRPGPNRPFNFFGSLNDKEVQYIKKMGAESQTSNHTVWFGHFPTSLIVHDPPVLRSVMCNGIAYLCGHLHTLGNFVPKMYSRQKTGMLELELGDWKVDRMFRIIAFDHDVMSFTDEYLGDWPLVLITNPKNSQFFAPRREPVEMLKYSSHIRILIFNPIPITSVTVEIDNVEIGEAKHVKGPLYVCEWNAMHYSYGLHSIEVSVKDEADHKRTVSHSFSVDGTSAPFRLIPRLILMPNLFSVGKVVFGVMVFLYTLILTSLRQCDHIRPYFINGIPVFSNVFNQCVNKAWIASRTNSAYYILIGCTLYLTFGPWFVDELLNGHTGVVFVWGIIFPGAFLSGGITYFYGIIQFLTFNLPLTYALGHLLERTHRYGAKVVGMNYISSFFPAALLFAVSVFMMMREFPRAYTAKSLYYGPLRTGNALIVPLSVWFALKSDSNIPAAVHCNN